MHLLQCLPLGGLPVRQQALEIGRVDPQLRLGTHGGGIPLHRLVGIALAVQHQGQGRRRP